MIAKVSGPFDLIFQDGSKQLYVPLLDRLVVAAAAGRPAGHRQRAVGRRSGAGLRQPSRRSSADDTRAIAEYNERLNAHPQLMTATIPLRDGVAISVKRSAMTVDAWLAAAIADAERRGLPD